MSSGREITEANAARVVRAVLDAFPSTHVVINAMTPRLVLQALEASPRLGLRVDCLGEVDMFSTLATSAEMQQRWRTAPVLSEWCGTSRPAPRSAPSRCGGTTSRRPRAATSGCRYAETRPAERSGFETAARAAGYRYEVRGSRCRSGWTATPSGGCWSRWRNVGSAPTYDDWDVVLRVRDKAVALAPRSADVDLGGVPRRGAFGRRCGCRRCRPRTYRMAVAVIDPTGYLAPMNLAIPGTHGRRLLPRGVGARDALTAVAAPSWTGGAASRGPCR